MVRTAVVEPAPQPPLRACRHGHCAGVVAGSVVLKCDTIRYVWSRRAGGEPWCRERPCRVSLDSYPQLLATAVTPSLASAIVVPPPPACHRHHNMYMCRLRVVVSPVRCALWQTSGPSDIDSVLARARTSWLRNEEVFRLLTQYSKYNLPVHTGPWPDPRNPPQCTLAWRVGSCRHWVGGYASPLSCHGSSG